MSTNIDDKKIVFGPASGKKAYASLFAECKKEHDNEEPIRTELNTALIEIIKILRKDDGIGWPVTTSFGIGGVTERYFDGNNEWGQTVPHTVSKMAKAINRLLNVNVLFEPQSIIEKAIGFGENNPMANRPTLKNLLALFKELETILDASKLTTFMGMFSSRDHRTQKQYDACQVVLRKTRDLRADLSVTMTFV